MLSPSTNPSNPPRSPPADPPLRNEPATSSSNSGRDITSSLAFRVAVPVACLVLLTACLVGALLFVRRCRRKKFAAVETAAAAAAGNGAPNQPVTGSPHLIPAPPEGDQAFDTFESAGTLIFASTVASEVARKTWVPREEPPCAISPEDSSLASRLRFINEQLDCFGPKWPLAGRYELLGSTQRRGGGVLLLFLLQSACSAKFRLSIYCLCMNGC